MPRDFIHGVHATSTDKLRFLKDAGRGKRMTPTALKCLTLLVWKYDQVDGRPGESAVSLDEFLDYTESSRSKVKFAISVLVDLGLVQVLKTASRADSPSLFRVIGIVLPGQGRGANCPENGTLTVPKTGHPPHPPNTEEDRMKIGSSSSIPNGIESAFSSIDEAMDSALFSRPCLDFVMRRTRKDERQARTLIGGWKKRYGAAHTLEALRVAFKRNPEDLVTYIVGVLEASIGRRKQSCERYIAQRQEYRSRQGVEISGGFETDDIFEQEEGSIPGFS